jgi:hypothetical protein
MRFSHQSLEDRRVRRLADPIRHLNFLLPLAALLGSVLSPFSSGAADIRVDPSLGVGEGAVLEGKIEAGDFYKVRDFIIDGPGAREIYLASPGGDLSEAMKIGLLVRLLKLATVVPDKSSNPRGRDAHGEHGLTNTPSDYMCASACFFVFIAGLHRKADAHGEAILGIHRPTILAKGLAKLSPGQVAASDMQARVAVQSYVKAMGIPANYADEMYSVPKYNIRWIRNDEFERDFDGFVPELRNIVQAMCAPHGSEGKSPDDGRAVNDYATACEQKIQNELASNARSAALRMREDQTRHFELNGMALPPLQ